MSKSLIAIALFMAATTAAAAPSHSRNASYGAGQGSDAAVTFVNAPGGDYIQCDSRNPSSPVRCKADGW
jgi:hypothetical protein